MDLDQMMQLDAIARLGTISAAAQELHHSQPALSRSMQRLETELGQKLFDRTRNRTQLNEAGLVAVDHARILLRDERAFRDAMDELARRERTLVVGTVAPAPMWRLTAQVVERFPGTILSPTTLEENELERQLLNREVDLAITMRPMILPTIKSTPLMAENLFAFLPKAHPLATRTTVSFVDLDGETFLVDIAAGFWLGMVREAMPKAHIITQSDRTVFMQLARSTDLLLFVTDAPQFESLNDTGPQDRVRVPIVDAAAHATFYLTTLNDAPAQVQEIARWMAR